MVKAIRGAITVKNNKEDEILSATKELLNEIININKISKEDMISIIFTMTTDLDAVFPAVAARQIGIDDIPLMCANEINVIGSLEKCIRALIHVNINENNSELTHVYLREAKILRPDLVKGE